MTRKADARVPSTRSLLALCVIGAAGMGLVTVLAIRNGTASLVLIAPALIALAFLLGVGLFAGLSRAATFGRTAGQDEGILAEGLGRDTGRMVGLVVIATKERIFSVHGSLMRRPRVAASIPYGDILKFEVYEDSLRVQGAGTVIALVKCPPNQVKDLAVQLRQHTGNEE